MKRVMIFMIAALLACTAFANDDMQGFSGPNAARLQELSSQMIALKAAEQYDAAIWSEFFTLLYGENLRGERASLDQGGDAISSALVIPSIPYTDNGTTFGYTNDYNPYCDDSYSRGPDVVYSYTPTTTETIQISLCGSYFDTKLYVYRNSSSNRIACSDDDCPQYRTEQGYISSLTVEPGNTYYIVVDGYRDESGEYFLRVAYQGCNHLPDGVTQDNNGVYTFRQTTSGSTTDTSLYGGPWYDESDCGNDDWKGFDHYSAHDQDYGWKHFWPNWNTPGLNVHSVQVLICAWDVDEYSCNLEYPGQPEYCELDNIYADGSMQSPTYLTGDNGVDWVTTFALPTLSVLDNGYVDMFMDINVFGPRDGQCWSTTLRWAQLVVTYSVQQQENHPPYPPTGYGMPCIDDNTIMCVTLDGPVPADPDGDEVTYQYEWFVSNVATGGGFQPDELNPNHPVNHDGPCIPAGDSDIGDTWRVHVFAVDEHGAQSTRYLEVTFPIIVFDCGEPPYTDLDMGDLDPCNYPTLVNNPAHGLSGIAWLGDGVSAETTPAGVNMDLFDDGVVFVDSPMIACYPARITVKVTGGQFYGAYADTGGLLYLNAWKDGNIDGDFCDYLCDGRVPEWIIRDVVVVPSDIPYEFDILDPGIDDVNELYDGIFRFRLTSRAVGQFGFGLIDRVNCQGMTCGTFAHDFLGEVEDYVVDDIQLAVEMGEFDATPGENRVTLSWNTVSESGNDHFDIERNGSIIGQVHSAGDSPSGHPYQWTDQTAVNGTEYTYTLYGIDVNGARRALATASATPGSLPITVTEYALHQNYPNPFNPLTNISFDLVEGRTVVLTVYNPVGQKVATVVNGSFGAGRHTVSFDASHLPSGMYLYRIDAGSYTATKKMLLMK